MEKIRFYLYLDTDKMNSIASQVFEGVIDSFIDQKEKEVTEFETQDGPIDSGNQLGDTFKKKSAISENKFLHDYSFNLLEKALIDDNKAIDLTSKTEIDENEIGILKLIKVKGKAIFNDAIVLQKTMSEFNNLGDAIAHMIMQDDKNQLEKEHTETANKIKDRNHKAKLKSNAEKEYKNLIKNIKIEHNLYLNEIFLEKLQYLMKYGLNDKFEIQLKMKNKTFSGILKREFLKENEELIINKFSRLTEAEINIFGLVTQTASYIPSSKETFENPDFKNFREAYLNMVNALIDMENGFIGKTEGEIIIDPIAVYVEI